MKLDLQTIQKTLEDILSGTSIIGRTPEIPQEILSVPILIDQKSREIALHIMILEPEDLEVEETHSPISLVQFYVGFPIEVQKERVLEMVSLLNLLNQISELAGFAMIEELPFPFFRYSLITKKGSIDDTILLAVAGMIIAIIESHAPLIALLGDNERTLKELMEKF